MMRYAAPILSALLLGLTSACTSLPRGAQLVTETTAMAPSRLEAYRLAPGDELEITFFHTPELNQLVTVRPDGRISLPLADGVVAAGKSPEQLALELETYYAQELREPEVAVIARTFSAWAVHVGGQVAEPAKVPLTVDMTLYDAITQAGGLLDTACRSQVLVIRPGEEGPQLIVANLDHVLNGKDPWQNVPLHPRDAIFVPKTPIANLNTFVDQYVRQMLPVDINYVFRLEDVQ
jgi:protein involved in polysaccharide export with SLBB domain